MIRGAQLFMAVVAASAIQQARGAAAVPTIYLQNFVNAAGNTPDDRSIAKALDSVAVDPRQASLINYLGGDLRRIVYLPDYQFIGHQPFRFTRTYLLAGSPGGLRRALDRIDPEELTGMQSSAISKQHVDLENLEQTMDDIRAGSSGFSVNGISLAGPVFDPGLAGPSGPEGESGKSVKTPESAPANRWGAFITGLGEFSDVSSTTDASGYDLTTGGFTLGGDYRITNHFAIGLTGGYTHTDIGLSNNGGVNGDSGHFAAYATAFTGGFYGDAAVDGGFDSYSSHRTALLGTASGSTEGNNIAALVATGYDWKMGALSVGPVADFQYTHVNIDGFTEHGSLAPLAIDAQHADSLRTSLGVKATYGMKLGPFHAAPELRAAWQHEYGDSTYSLASGFADGAGSSFTVRGPAVGRDTFLLRAGLSLQLNQTLSIYAYYDGELATDNYQSNNVSAGVRLAF